MPIRADMRDLYPADWPEISHYVRFIREGGFCEECGRQHGMTYKRLADGRWYDPVLKTWRNADGTAATVWPDLIEQSAASVTVVYLAAAHRDHDPTHNDDSNLKAWCQRCHLLHDAPFHRYRRWLTMHLRKAIGDLFFGDYEPYYNQPGWTEMARLLFHHSS